MGIPGFYGRWITRNVANAIFRGVPGVVSSLSFDLNGVIHDARNRVYAGETSDDPALREAIAKANPKELEYELHEQISRIILEMIDAVHPMDCLILAVDGVAPAAKLQQQRGRRERSAKESPGGLFDRNAITPGTTFMLDLDNYLQRFIARYRNQLPPKVIYSSHLDPGEGEHKIMEFFRDGQVSDGPAAKEDGAHIVYGLDADLIMLSLLSPVNNIVLARETVRDTLSIDEVKRHIASRTTSSFPIDDFVVMMFYMGNDFLPHMPALEDMGDSITMLLDIYSDGKFELTLEDGRSRVINWPEMNRFVAALAEREPGLLAAASTHDVKYPNTFIQSAISGGKFYPDSFRNIWYRNALGARGEPEFTSRLMSAISKYEPTPEDFTRNVPLANFVFVGPNQPEPEGTDQRVITTISEVTPQRIQDMIIDYMRTMSMVYLYYREGTSAVNQDWAYPFYHAPLLSDLAVVMTSVNKAFVVTGYQAYPMMKSFTALHQMVAVLPLESRDQLPKELHPLFSYNSTIRDIFPHTFKVEMDGKNEDHAGVPIVPLVDRRRVNDAVAQIAFAPNRAAIWLPKDPMISVRDADEAYAIEVRKLIQRERERFQAEQVRQRERRQDRGRGRGRGGFSRPTAPTTAHTAPTRGGFRGRVRDLRGESRPYVRSEREYQQPRRREEREEVVRTRVSPRITTSPIVRAPPRTLPPGPIVRAPPPRKAEPRPASPVEEWVSHRKIDPRTGSPEYDPPSPPMASTVPVQWSQTKPLM